jgi:hypothetical protein
MPAWRRCTLVLLLAASVVSAADPALLRLVMPEAKIISGANVSQFVTSPLGRFLLAQLQASEPDLRNFVLATGFDPLRDVTEVLMASAADPKEKRGVLLARGVFDPARIAAFARQSGTVVQSYNGVHVMMAKPKADPWIAFLDASTVVVGDARSVQGVIDHAASGPGPGPELIARVNHASGLYDFWVVSAVPASSFADSMPTPQMGGILQGDVMRGIVGTSGGIKFGPSILIAGEAVTRSEKEATALADVVRFFVGMAQMSAQKNPQAAAATAFFQRLDLKTEGNVMRLALTVPEADLEKFIQQVQQKAKPRPASSGVVIRSSPKDMGTVTLPAK